MTTKPKGPTKAKPASQKPAKPRSSAKSTRAAKPAGKSTRKPATASSASTVARKTKAGPKPTSSASATTETADLETAISSDGSENPKAASQNSDTSSASSDTVVSRKAEPDAAGNATSSDDAGNGAAYRTETPRIVPPRSKVTGAARGLAWITLVVGLVVAIAAVTWPWWSERFADAFPFLRDVEQQETAIIALNDRVEDLEKKTDILEIGKSETLTQLENERAKLREQVKTMMARLAEVESSVQETRGLLKAEAAKAETQAATKSLKALSDRLSALEQGSGQFDDLSARVAQVEKDQAVTKNVLNSIGPDSDLSAGLDDMKSRVSKLETAPVPIAIGDSTAKAIVLAVAQLRDTVRRGAPLANDLEALAAIAGDNADIKKSITQLTKYGKVGVPTVTSLRARFSKMAGTVAAAGQTSEPQGWIDEVVGKVTSLVRVRRVGDAAPEGSLDAIVASVDNLLAAGDLKGAVNKLSPLDGKAAEILALWLSEARARLDAETAVASLHVLAVSLLAPAKAGG